MHRISLAALVILAVFLGLACRQNETPSGIPAGLVAEEREELERSLAALEEGLGYRPVLPAKLPADVQWGADAFGTDSPPADLTVVFTPLSSGVEEPDNPSFVRIITSQSFDPAGGFIVEMTDDTVTIGDKVIYLTPGHPSVDTESIEAVWRQGDLAILTSFEWLLPIDESPEVMRERNRSQALEIVQSMVERD